MKQAPPVAETAPAQPSPPAAEEAAGVPGALGSDLLENVEEEQEHDLNDVEGCVAYMVACFPDKELQDSRKVVEETARFYVTSELRKKTGKKNPLYHVFQLAVIKSNVLASKKGRHGWLHAWQQNRALRFAKPPKATKS